MSSTFHQFKGNCPGNVSKDARYRVKHNRGKYVIGLFYKTQDGEQWYPTSDQHSELVEMVNKVKLAINGQPGGSFYINEYQQVLVPCMKEGYYFAGEYHKPLTFDFEGKIITGDAVNIAGQPINPGEDWFGPHPGVPYKLKAGGKDISYQAKLRPGVEKEVKLSELIGLSRAGEISRKIAMYKGSDGGRFYVNERLNAFTPVNGEYGIKYIYLGKIDLANWFPKPVIE